MLLQIKALILQSDRKLVSVTFSKNAVKVFAETTSNISADRLNLKYK